MINKFNHLFSGMQRRGINTGAIQLSVANRVEDSDGRADAVDRSTPHIILHPYLLLHFIGIIQHRVFKHRDQRSSEWWRSSKARIFNGFGHEEVQISHVWEMFVAFLVISKVHVATLGQVPEVFCSFYSVYVEDCRVVESWKRLRQIWSTPLINKEIDILAYNQLILNFSCHDCLNMKFLCKWQWLYIIWFIYFFPPYFNLIFHFTSAYHVYSMINIH